MTGIIDSTIEERIVILFYYYTSTVIAKYQTIDIFQKLGKTDAKQLTIVSILI